MKFYQTDVVKIMRSIKFFIIFSLSFTTTIANALTLSESTSSRGAFVFPSGPPGASSYDGPGKDTMSLFAPYVASNLLQVNSFNSNTFGSSVSAFLLSEVAAFDGTVANQSNNFGVVDNNGNFTSILDSKNVNPGDVGSLDQAAGKELTFALQSPEGLFYSVDSKNTDGGVAHMLALKADKDGTITIPQTNLKGNGPLSFNLLSGDIILFIEDMKLSGNISSGLVPFASDFDYNDMIIVVRQSANANQVPEPASLLLLGIGAGIANFKRRRRAV
jgi:hypothetical protein